MKLTRKKLRRLIRESLEESKYYISNPKGEVTPAFSAYEMGAYKDELAADSDPAIGALMQADNYSVKQGRELAHILADPDSELAKMGPLTPEEEVAVDVLAPQDKEGDQRHTFDIEYPVDKGTLLGAMKSKSVGILNRFGFQYVKDIFTADDDYGDFGPQFRFQAKALGCEVEDLAFVDIEEPQPQRAYNSILDIMREMKPPELPIPGDVGDFGQNSLYDLDGLKVLTTGHMGGYYTITICGQ